MPPADDHLIASSFMLEALSCLIHIPENRLFATGKALKETDADKLFFIVVTERKIAGSWSCEMADITLTRHLGIWRELLRPSEITKWASHETRSPLHPQMGRC